MENKEPDDDLFDRLNVSETHPVKRNYEVICLGRKFTNAWMSTFEDGSYNPRI